MPASERHRYVDSNKEAVAEWAQRPAVLSRLRNLQDSYRSSKFGANAVGDLRPEFVLIHTFAHLIINQLSFECGYGSSSIRERIYCEKADNEYDNDSNTILTDSDTITTLSQKDPQAGTFRAVPKTKIQKLGSWWVKTYYPDLYSTAGAKSTAAWFKRYGKALSEILNLADGNIPLAISSVIATEEQMAEFQKRKGEAVCWGLEAVSRNFTENFNRANEILNSGNLPKEVMQYA